MINIVKIVKTRKSFIKALFLNTLSFSVYIIAQQLLFMPLMGRWLSEELFANFVIYIAVFSILSNSLGGELGIVNQIDEHKDPTNYRRTLIKVSLASAVVSFIALAILNFSIIDNLMLSFVVFLANLRLYTGGFFRKKRRFGQVLIQNALYLIGMGLGLALFNSTKNIWLPSFLAEVFSLVYSIPRSDLSIKIGKEPSRVQKKRFASFSFVSLLTNLITFLDKIIIYPILGPLAVDTYYSVTTMSKIANMVFNPLHGVLLSWIKDENRKTIVNKFIVASVPLSILAFLFCIPLTYLALKILYPQFLEQAVPIIFPVSIGLGASIGSSLLKSLLLKFTGNKNLIKIYVVYFCSLIIAAVVSSYIWGIIGFSFSIAATKTLLYVEFVYSLKRIGKGGK